MCKELTQIFHLQACAPSSQVDDLFVFTLSVYPPNLENTRRLDRLVISSSGAVTWLGDPL
ncbi:hypothetical protein KDAU_29320 [Dictyobacter aurantiacus]|uniref:Uncharacterized protein n=1 Tax=Dictyobacter aurantiacus TaxID=1936993 RepID=A0A401ZFM9_9CHLR|nr:hypothetical protein KDAU_29320 [Dictyobacter aurantiacus]